MKLIVGLGNPGPRYSCTRHNAGRLLVEYMTRHEGAVAFKTQKNLKASIARVRFDSEEVSLAYPETFMNACGESVSLLVQHFGLDIRRDLLIVVDDVALPFGRWRLRSRGSDGGHNGLKSIQQALATFHYARLRMGIGSNEAALSWEGELSLEAFVLKPFGRDESEALPGILEKGREACRLWGTQPIARAMNVVNA